MKADFKILTPEEWDKAHRIISAWRNDPAGTVPCPRCGTEGMTIEDQSARPYAEWYALACKSCGLNVTVHLPLAPPPGAPV